MDCRMGEGEGEDKMEVKSGNKKQVNEMRGKKRKDKASK